MSNRKKRKKQVDENPSWTVYVDDNFKAMGDGRELVGTFARYDDAVACAKRIVDAYLDDAAEKAKDAKELYENYKMFGEDPFIAGTAVEGKQFSAWLYAQDRCYEIKDK